MRLVLIRIALCLFIHACQVVLTRAKEILKSALMMNLESRMILFEDIGTLVYVCIYMCVYMYVCVCAYV